MGQKEVREGHVLVTVALRGLSVPLCAKSLLHVSQVSHSNDSAMDIYVRSDWHGSIGHSSKPVCFKEDQFLFKGLGIFSLWICIVLMVLCFQSIVLSLMLSQCYTNSLPSYEHNTHSYITQ